MKKFLSLVLALVMTMSLVTVSAGAKDFTDSDKIQYDEAVAVMSAIKVVDGYADGNFKPQGSLTRGAAAKIICNMILSPTTAAELHADTDPFKDVPVTSDFAGYIAYCAQKGIISGYADGTFRPAGTLTGYAFMKMLLGALGYESENEGYTGANWSIRVAKQALSVGLNDSLEGDFNGIKAVTREEACLYAFNTLKATMVEYENKTVVSLGGANVTMASPAKDLAWGTGTKQDGNIDKDGFVQFAEKYFPKLELDNTTDVFGRPSREWTFKGNEIGTYVNTDLLIKSYTTKVTGKDLYDLLGKEVLNDKDYDVNVYIDGETEKGILENAGYFTAGNLVKGNDKKVGATGNGVLTEVYVDSDNKDVTIAIINTYLAVADKDYDEKKEEATFAIWGIEDAGKDQFVKTGLSTDKVKLDASADDFAVEDVEEDDIVLVTVADGAIQTIADPETLDEVEISAFKKNSNLTVDGTKYSYADTACYDGTTLVKYTSEDGVTINLKDATYNVILDQYGYAIGVEEIDPEDNYVFVTGFDGKYSNLSTKTATVGAIFIDGTIKSTSLTVKETVAGSDNNNVPTGEIYTLYNSSNWVIAAVVMGEDNGSSTNYAYVTSDDVELESYDKTTKDHTWSREVVIDGKLTTISYVDDTIDEIDATSMKQGEWYEVKYFADGTVKSTEKVVGTNDTNADKFVGKVEDIDDTFDTYTGDTAYLLNATATKLTYKNGSLYTNNDVTKGFAVSPEVTVVLCNADGKGVAFDTVSDEYEGYDGLEDAIDDANNNFTGTVSAILEGGVATTVILNCTAADPGYNGGTDKTDDSLKTLYAYGGNQKITLNVDLAGAAAENTDVKVTVKVLNGGTWVEMDTYTVTVAKGATQGTKVEVTGLLAGQYKVECGKLPAQTVVVTNA